MNATTSALQAGIHLARTSKSTGRPLLTHEDAVQSAKIQRILDGDKSRLDFNGAIEIGTALGWGVFSTDDDIRAALSETLLNLVTHPLAAPQRWVVDATRGRASAILRLRSSTEFRSILEILSMARLLDGNDEFAQVWWARLQNLGRLMQRTSDKTDYWIICERASFEREQAFLRENGCASNPDFKSIEDSTVGYDIGSFRLEKSGNWRHHFIEVKSTEVEAPRRFHISANEWQFAYRNQNSWQLDFYGPRVDDVQIFSYSEISRLVPQNTKSGFWNDCIVTIEMI